MKQKTNNIRTKLLLLVDSEQKDYIKNCSTKLNYETPKQINQKFEEITVEIFDLVTKASKCPKVANSNKELNIVKDVKIDKRRNSLALLNSNLNFLEKHFIKSIENSFNENEAKTDNNSKFISKSNENKIKFKSFEFEKENIDVRDHDISTEGNISAFNENISKNNKNYSLFSRKEFRANSTKEDNFRINNEFKEASFVPVINKKSTFFSETKKEELKEQIIKSLNFNLNKKNEKYFNDNSFNSEFSFSDVTELDSSISEVSNEFEI